MTQLMQVRSNGCILYFPDTFPQQQRYRGGEGYVVDLDAPLEREWCAGQMHKLEPAAKGAKAASIEDPVALRLQKNEVARLAAEGSKPKASAPPEELEVTRPARAGAA